MLAYRFASHEQRTKEKSGMRARLLLTIAALVAGAGLLYVLVATVTEDRSDTVRPRSATSVDDSSFKPRGMPE
jgi:hypothetical protein